MSDPLPPFGGRPPYKGDIKARRIKDASLPLSRKKDRKSFVFDSPSSLLSWGRPTGLAGDTREGGDASEASEGVAHTSSGIASAGAPGWFSDGFRLFLSLYARPHSKWYHPRTLSTMISSLTKEAARCHVPFKLKSCVP